MEAGKLPKRRLGLLIALAALILALGAVPGLAQGEATTLRFSGYSWAVIDSPESRGPGPNIFDGRNVSLDSAGHLVLEISGQGGAWTSAHVFLTRSLGYGSYELALAPYQGSFDSRAVLGFFTWDDSPDFANREIDIEISRWGEDSGPNLFFTVQPGEGHEERQAAFDLDLSQGSVLGFEWRRDSIYFWAEAGGRIWTWSFPSKGRSSTVPFLVPPRGGERVGINLWLMGGKSGEGQPLRLELERFSFRRLP